MKPQTVSLCVIAYNEEKFLPNLLRDFEKQTYNHALIEIVLVDGKSADATKSIMLSFAHENKALFKSIKVTDNEKRIQAAGWNVALMTATSDVIIRIDAHTSIPPEFTELNMNNLQNGEMVSGGVRPCLIENETIWGKALLQTENSLFGSSISKSRSGTKKEYVKTMFHAAYRREVFSKVGGFNENLLRTEDNEMHYRINQAGYKLCFDPQIISFQYARSSLKKMIRQKFGNGYWIGLTLGVAPGCVSIYHMVPLAFVLGIVITSALAYLGIWQLAGIMWLLYFLFGIINMVIAFRDGFNPCLLLMPFLFLILHISYGVGTLKGVIECPFKKKKLRTCPEIEIVKNCINKRSNNQ